MNSTRIENITPEFLSLIKTPKIGAKKLNYLMVIPVLAKSKDSQYGFPVGFASVTSALKASGRNVFTLNLNYKDDPSALLERTIVENRIDVVMIGGFSVQFWDIKEIADTAKNAKPNVIIVVGGGIVSSDPITAMEAFENVDYGVIGEGEIKVNDLAYALEAENDITKVEGIVCRINGDWTVCGESQPIPDMNILPFPDYEGFEYSQLFKKDISISNIYNWSFPSENIAFMSISRSCHYNCTFCFHTCGKKYKRLSMDNIFKLLDWILSLYPNQIKALNLSDELSFSDPEFTIEFCRRIEPYHLVWKASTRADRITKEMMISLKESGCRVLFVGIESADNNILKSLRKHITIEQVEKVFSIGTEIGLNMNGYLIFGDVEDEEETFWRSMNWWLSHQDWNIDFGFIRAYPGSALYKNACERGIIKERVQLLKDGFPLVNMTKMSDDAFFMLPTIVRLLTVKNKLLKGIIEPQNNFTVNVHGICPHCQKSVDFKHIESLFDTDPYPCPVCCKDIVINAIEHCDAEKLSEKWKTIINGENIAVWAITIINHFWLLKAIPALAMDNAIFINQNKLTIPENDLTIKKLGGEDGKIVLSPDILASTNIETIFVPNTPSVYKSIKEQCDREFPHIKRIIHITELL